MTFFVLGLEDAHLEDDIEDKFESAAGGDTVLYKDRVDDSPIKPFLEDFEPVCRILRLLHGFPALFEFNLIVNTIISVKTN